MKFSSKASPHLFFLILLVFSFINTNLSGQTSPFTFYEGGNCSQDRWRNLDGYVYYYKNANPHSMEGIKAMSKGYSDRPGTRKLEVPFIENGLVSYVTKIKKKRSYTLFQKVTSRGNDVKNAVYPQNDEFRSFRIEKVNKGSWIEFYDNADCKKNDDWQRVNITKYISNFCVGSLEETKNKNGADRHYHRKNGLAGKVSCIKYKLIP